MFNKALSIPTFLREEGSEELEKLGIESPVFGEVGFVHVWNIIECCGDEIEGKEGTVYHTGSRDGGMFSPLKEKEFVEMVDKHIEKYGRR